MVAEFSPKGEEVLKSEVLEDLGMDYDGNEEVVDRVIARRLKDEEFKASLHADKKKHLEGKQVYAEIMKKAGIDPETGQKVSNDIKPNGGDTTPKNDTLSAKDIIAIRDLHEEDAEYLIEEAKLRGKAAAEMKKDPYMKIILQTRAEERKTAEVTNVASTKKGTSENSDNVLQERVSKSDESMTQEEMKLAAKNIVENIGK